MNSNFQIENIYEANEFHQLIVTNKISKEYISVLPNQGGRLNAARLRHKDKILPTLWELSNSDFNSNDELFNNAFLFPFAGRIRKGTYSFENNSYQLELNYLEEENACHGFLYNQPFNIESKQLCDDYAEIKLSYNSYRGFKGYPFPFKVDLSYKLTSNGQVIISSSISNTSDTKILFSTGWHPYYTLGDSIDDLILEFTPTEEIELDEFNIPTNIRKKFDSNRITLLGESLDNVYTMNNQNKRKEFKLISKTLDATLNIWQESGNNKFKYLVLYTPPHRKSIAIEPLTSNINSFNNKEDLIILNPGEKWSSEYGFGFNN
jgi:aldose 1-epimerase